MGALILLNRRSLLAVVALFLMSNAQPASRLTAQDFPARWRTDPGLEGVRDELAADPWIFSRLPGIGGPGAYMEDTLTIWLVSEFRARNDIPDVPPEDWVAGVAVPGEGTVILRGSTGRQGLGELRQTLRHEVAHIALSAATAGNAPRWLQEGYAQFAAGAWGANEAWRLQIAFMHGGPSLHTLALRFPSRRDSASLAYLLSYTAVAELYDLAGEPGLTRTFESLAAGNDLDASLRSVFGITEAQFEDRWRRRVAGRYGWLYALSRASLFWFALTVALLVLGYRRRRYNRMRWEALRQAEAAAERRLPVWPHGGLGGGAGPAVTGPSPHGGFPPDEPGEPR